MKVVQVSDIREEIANGVYMAVAGLAAHLPEAGVEVEAWHLSADAKTIGQRQVGGVTVFDLPAHRNAASLLWGLPAQTRQFVRQRQTQVDVVHLHSVFIPNNIWLSKLLTVPYVLTSHGGYSRNVLRGSNRLAKAFWLARYERTLQRNAKFVHAVSESEKEEIVRNWPPPMDVSPSRDFVFIGRLSAHQKGLDRLIRGFAKFAADPASAGFRLVLGGPDWRGGQASLQSLARELNLTERVVFLGPVFGRAKDQLLAGAHAFVLTSRWEGMPVSILEALASGTPVLITPETNVGPIVGRYEAGLRVEGNDEAIAQGLLALARSTPQQMRQYGQNARLLVEENFTWPVVARQMHDLYADAMGRKSTAKTEAGRQSLANVGAL
jgi:glycosyltransferase involved in cell wall biosynthesis